MATANKKMEVQYECADHWGLTPSNPITHEKQKCWRYPEHLNDSGAGGTHNDPVPGAKTISATCIEPREQKRVQGNPQSTLIHPASLWDHGISPTEQSSSIICKIA